MTSRPERGQKQGGLRALFSGLIPGAQRGGNQGSQPTKSTPRIAEPAPPAPLRQPSSALRQSSQEGRYIDPSHTLPIESKVQSQLRRAVGKSDQSNTQPVTLRKPKSIQAAPAKPASASVLRKRSPAREIHLPTQLAVSLREPSSPKAEIRAPAPAAQSAKPARPAPKSLPPSTRSKGRDFPIL